MAPKLKLLSLNVNHARHLGGLAAMIRSNMPDIVCLQEVPGTSAQLEQVVGQGFSGCVNPGRNGEPGTAIVFRKSIQGRITCLEPGRIQELEWTGGGKRYRVLNVYGPAGTQRAIERQKFFGEDLLRVVQV